MYLRNFLLIYLYENNVMEKPSIVAYAPGRLILPTSILTYFPRYQRRRGFRVQILRRVEHPVFYVSD